MHDFEDDALLTGDKDQRALAQEARASEAIRAITAGANPADEALALANEYSDGLEVRIRSWLRRILTRN